MTKCDYCQHVEMCGWRKRLGESGCDFFDEVNRWIPVSERLPDKRNWYLTVFKEKDTGYQLLIPRVADYIGENNWRIIDEDGLIEEYRDILECVAWMPLPEPYRAESKEDLDNLDSMLKDLWNATESEVEE